MDPNCKLADQAGCKECNNDLSNLFSTGYYVPPNGTDCELCEKSCKLCSEFPHHCSACIANYTLVYVAKNEQTGEEGHYECREKDDDCLEAEMGYCTKCKEGYFIGQETA